MGKIETEGIGRLTLEELLKMELFLGVRRNSKPGGLRQRAYGHSSGGTTIQSLDCVVALSCVARTKCPAV